MAPTKDLKQKGKKAERQSEFCELKKQPHSVLTKMPQVGLVSHTKTLAKGLVKQDLEGLQAWVGKKRGQEGLFYLDDEIRVIYERKKANLLVDLDSFSEKDITRSVIAKLRPGFPAMFRNLAKYGRKPGMRGKPTYFYTKELVDENWPSAVRLTEYVSPVKINIRPNKSMEKPAEKIGGGDDHVQGEAPTGGHLEDLVLREIEMSCNRSWDEFAGLQSTKIVLQENAVWPLLRPDIFTGIRKTSKVLLLFGPPGNEKLLLAECVATQTSSTFFSTSATQLLTKCPGDGEKLVKVLFDVAKNHSPSVLFVNDVDVLTSVNPDDDFESKKIKLEFICQMEKMADDGQALLIGATSKPHEIGEVSRNLFGKKLFIPLPDHDARVKILSRLLSAEINDVNEEEIDMMSIFTEGYSGLDLVRVCQEAALGPVRSLNISEFSNINVEMLRPILYEDLNDALDQVKSSVESSDVQQFMAWSTQFAGR